MFKRILHRIKRAFFYICNPKRPIETLEITQEDIEMAQRIQESLLESKRTHAWKVFKYILKNLEEEEIIFRITFIEGLIAILANALEKENMLTNVAFATESIDILLPDDNLQDHTDRYKIHPAWNILDETIERLVSGQDWIDNFPREAILTVIIDMLLINNVLKQEKDIDFNEQKPSIYEVNIRLIPHYDVVDDQGLKIQEIAVDGTLLWEREFILEEK